MTIDCTSHGPRGRPIPRTIHQTWRCVDVPLQWRALQQSWWDAHPDWQYCFWSDADIDRLVEEYEPAFAPTYRSFPRSIQRVDAAKAIILKHRGGIYCDLDTECHRAVGPLLMTGGAVLSRTRDGVIDGAFMASAPQHPLWNLVLAEMGAPPWYAIVLRYWPGLQASYVLLSTGPFALRRALRRYVRTQMTAGVTVLAPPYCSNVSWWQRHRAVAPTRDTFVRHHYGDSWLTPLERLVVAVCTPWRVAVAGVLIALGIVLLLVGG